MTEIQDVEVIIGKHESGYELVQGLNTSTSRNFCAKCRRDIHCRVVVDKETGEAIIQKNCSNDSCRCGCRTNYVCPLCGHLHPYGTRCNRVEEEHIITPENEDHLQEILSKWRKKTEEDNNKVETKS